MASLDSPSQSDPELFLAWDDQLVLHWNDEPVRELGIQTAFRQESISLRLRKGRNTLVLKLDNRKGNT